MQHSFKLKRFTKNSTLFIALTCLITTHLQSATRQRKPFGIDFRIKSRPFTEKEKMLKILAYRIEPEPNFCSPLDQDIDTVMENNGSTIKTIQTRN